MRGWRADLRRRSARLDQLPRQHRVVLLAVVLLLAVLAWQHWWAIPLLHRGRELQTRIGQTDARVRDLRSQVEEAATGGLPQDLANRREKQSLEQQIGLLDAQLQQLTASMISPREMAPFLADLLRQDAGLRLVRMENLGAEPIFPQASGENQPVAGTNLYRHTLRMEFAGNYLGALEYLRRLEEMPKRLAWETLEIHAEELPVRIILTVHTLSLYRGWIGV